MGVRTLDCAVLLGWMRREEAVRFLLEECWHGNGLSIAGAEDLWQIYRSRVESLPARPAAPAKEIPLGSADWKAARQFHNRQGDARDILRFVRVDPRELQVFQLHVVTDSSGDFQQRLENDGWFQTALMNDRNGHQIRWRVEHSQIVFELPHGEFILTGPALPDARMQVRPRPSFVSVGEFENRMLLVNGHHRTYAWLNRSEIQDQSPGSRESTLLFPVSNILPFPNPPDQSTLDILLAPRPPFFGDFFDDHLSLPVQLRRKKRYEMRVEVALAGIDEDAEHEQGMTGAA